MASNETVFRSKGTAHPGDNEEKPPALHSAILKQNQYEVYDASKGNTEAM